MPPSFSLSRAYPAGRAERHPGCHGPSVQASSRGHDPLGQGLHARCERSARQEHPRLDRGLWILTVCLHPSPTLSRSALLSSGVVPTPSLPLSRSIPIHVPGSRGEILGLLMVKDLALVDPSRATPVADMVLRSAPRVFDDTSLQDLLDLFQTGRSHLALLVKRPDSGSTSRASGNGEGREGRLDVPLVSQEGRGDGGGTGRAAEPHRRGWTAMGSWCRA